MLFLSKYSKEKRRFASASTLVSALIASVAGFGIAAAFFFPNLDKTLLASLAALFGSLVAVISLWERRREELRLITICLKEARSEAKGVGEDSRKKELIEQFLKAEGL